MKWVNQQLTPKPHTVAVFNVCQDGGVKICASSNAPSKI